MHSLTRLFSAGALAAAAFGVLAQPAFAKGRDDHHARDQRAVFVPTNEATGNHIVAYDRGSDGNLTFAASFATGGQGGSLSGAAVDKLASQGSLTYDSSHHLLYAVNAGSNTVSVFRADGFAALAPSVDQLWRHVPGERCHLRQPGLRAERTKRWHHPGLPSR